VVSSAVNGEEMLQKEWQGKRLWDETASSGGLVRNGEVFVFEGYVKYPFAPAPASTIDDGHHEPR
jgi:hypothetical protein